MNRHRFATFAALYSVTCALNRLSACEDSAEFIDATEFSHAFDAEMNRANRASFWEAA